MTVAVGICAWCEGPIADGGTRAGGKLYHADCYEESLAPHCWYDGKRLEGTCRVDAWGHPYCPAHDRQWPRCIYCRRFITNWNGRGPIADARDRCDACAAVAVTSEAVAAARIDQAWAWLRGQGVTLAHTVAFGAEMVNSDEIDPDDEDPGAGFTLGVTGATMQGEAVRELTIRWRYGMPSPLFESVVVHELGHAWLRLTGIGGNVLAKSDEEGFCELLAWRWLSAQPTPEAAWYARGVMENADPVYGDGARRLRALADRVGFATIIDTLRREHRLPR